MRDIKATRTEQTLIKPSHEVYKVINEFSVRSRILYNYANWFCRQCYIREKHWLRYQDMQKMFKNDRQYKELMSQSSQCVLQVLEKNWKSFLKGIKEYDKNPHKFFNKPKMPKYLRTNGWSWILKNNQTYIKNNRLYFRLKVMNGYSFKTSIPDYGRLISVRFTPRNGNFVLEIVYEIEIRELKIDNGKAVSIDLGVNNFITMTNNIGQKPTIIKGSFIKSENQWYNKRRADRCSKLTNSKWSKHLDRISVKRYNRVKNYMHHVSKYVIDYCIANDINTVIVGLNETWKQNIELGKRTNQNFVFIPYNLFIKQLQYKCEDNGMIFITTEEGYTSGTSALDDELPIKRNYDKSRRIERGLFRSNKGILINSDVNGSLQIAKKVNPNIYKEYGLGECLNPIVIKDIFSCYKLSA